MNYKEFKDGVYGMILPYSDEYTQQEIEDLDRLMLLYTNMAVDNMQREIYPLEKSETLTGKECLLPEDMICFLGAGERERYKLKYDEAGRQVIQFEEDGAHTVRYTYRSGPVSGEDYEFAFPEEAVGAMMYFAAYHLLAGDNDTRQYAAFYSLYNQACANILANRPKRCAFTGGLRNV